MTPLAGDFILNFLLSKRLVDTNPNVNDAHQKGPKFNCHGLLRIAFYSFSQRDNFKETLERGLPSNFMPGNLTFHLALLGQFYPGKPQFSTTSSIFGSSLRCSELRHRRPGAPE